ncbi:glycosyltransferase family 4 protein, partial [Candidatus Micrarchaeota archaeon]|nr:glycosyltransferase family 4 protein [Candidatus Micrarchaeota archaeon]
MKIGIIADSIREKRTGIGNYTFNLIHELKKINTNNQKNQYYLIDNATSKTHVDSEKTIIIKNPLKKISKVYFWYLYTALKLRGIEKKFDLIHNPSQAPTFFKIKNNVITVHDITPILFPEKHSFIRSLIYRLFMGRTLKNAKKIIADSESTKKDLIKVFKLPEEKIKVIYLGVNENFKIITNKKKLDESKEKFSLFFPFILTVSTLEPRKNIPNLIRAFSTLKKEKKIRQKLVVAGQKGWKYKEIFDLTRKLGMEKEIIFLGYISEDKLICIYNLADLFVFPSFYEGFGFPVLEAMKCGCPVITSNVSSLPEVSGNAAIQ